MIEAIIHFEFMRNAVISGIMVGFLAPIIGVFLVVRRLSMIADALSHVTLSGITFSILLGKLQFISILFGGLNPFSDLNPIYMGMLFSVLGALMIERLRRSYPHYQELAIPIILSSGIGLGVVFISLANGMNANLFNYLFGSILTIAYSDMLTISVVTPIVLFVTLLFYKELFSLSFDAENARTTGIPKSLINLIFMLLVAIVIASTMRIVGILLVSSLMVLPVAASIKIANSFKQTFFYAILFGQISVLTGMYIAYEFDWAPGGTIVICSFLILCMVISINKWILRLN